jgi:hypothetical protein
MAGTVTICFAQYGNFDDFQFWKEALIEKGACIFKQLPLLHVFCQTNMIGKIWT